VAEAEAAPLEPVPAGYGRLLYARSGVDIRI
jgi:hypothetical protein